MAGSATAHSVVVALAGNAGATRGDVAMDWTSQRCCNGRQRAGPRNVAMMADSALQPWPMLRCGIFFF